MASIRTDHPRLWMTPTILADLKARATPTDDRWNTLLSLASGPASWDVGIFDPALCYLITGDARFAVKAWSLMAQSMQAGVGQVTPDSYYQCRNFFPAAAIVYDWLHDWLSLGQRQQLQASIEMCADSTWPETNPERASGWAIDSPGSNYYHGFLLTWMAGLALAGESSKAQGYIDNAHAKFNSRVLPYLGNEAKGGVWSEGTGYGTVSTMEMLQYLLANRSATGEDLVRANPWFTEAVNAMLQLTNPPMTEIAPFGDLGSGPIADKHRIVMLMLCSYDNRCRPWLDAVTPARCTQRLNAYAEYLWYPGAPLPPGEKQ